jgi:DNA-binding NarL/FixJ family response regulator
MDKIRILVADDNKNIRQELLSFLSAQKNLQVLGEAVNGLEALQMCADLNPDIVLMDIVMPKMHGLEATKIISEKYPSVKVILMTLLNDEEYSLAASKNGAKGFILKDAPMSELLQAIEVVSYGGRFFKNISAQILKGKQEYVLNRYRAEKNEF